MHYDSEPGRRPLLHRLVGDGTLGTAYATDDGVGLHYVGTSSLAWWPTAPTPTPTACERHPDGTVTETRIDPERLDLL